MDIILPPLEPWQKDVIHSFDETPKDKWFVIKSLRQCGKSVLAQVLLIYASFKEAESVSLSISPTIAQSRKMYQDVERIARPLVKKANGSILEITFINGSTILFKSAEQSDSVRGFTVKKAGIAVVDECAYINDEFIYSVVVPTTNVWKAPIFFFSTPRFKRGFFYNCYIKGWGGVERIKSFDWTHYDLSKYLSPEILEVYRKQMPKASFQAEYLGEFIDGDGAVFGDFKDCIQDTRLDYSLPVYLGIDWGTGTGQDYTVISIAQLKDNHINITDQVSFNDLNAKQTTERIVSIVRSITNKGCKEVNVVVEKNGIGNVYLQLLAEALDNLNDSWNEIEVNLSTFLTTNKSKERVVKQLIKCFEEKMISIPRIDELIVELSAYECKVNQNGALIYNAPSSFHDDAILSICFLMQPLYNELEYEI